VQSLISIIIPTKNEEGNIKKLLQGIWDALVLYIPEVKYEAIVVDDGNDKTAMIARSLKTKVIKGKRQGLGQAIIDGIEVSQGDIVVVMDADGSHRPQDIPNLLKPILEQGADMTIGSRYVKGGSNPGWSLGRRIVSRVACLLALPVTRVKDATSGFFACRKNILQEAKLRPTSWKIMLEVLVKTNPTKVVEVPIQFDERQAGESKFNNKQIVAYIKHLLLLALHKYRRFIKFCMVGGSGALITLILTWLFTEISGLWYMLSLGITIVIVVTWNFSLNAAWTFAQNRNPNDADYDWASFYKGNPIQKWWKQSIANIVWKWIPDASDLLNMGCGSSPIATHYPSSVNIDTNEDKLNYLKGKLPGLVIKKMSIEELSYDSNSFDHVLCIEVLEHLNNPEKTISEISRVLKPGGKAVIATPDYSRKWWLLAERFTPAGEQHIYHFTRKSLEEVCQRYGLTPLEHRYVAGCDLCEIFERKNND